MERLQKIMARAGIASRRKCEKFILEGRVKVNNEVIRELGVKADPERDTVEVDGRKIGFVREKVYVALNKPAGYLTSVTDPFGRPTVLDLVGEREVRIFPVGRLDMDTEGLILLTNDGELAFRLMHPRFKVEKSYLAEVRGFPENNILDCLRRGIILEDGATAPARVKVAKRNRDSTEIEVTIREGRKRQVKRMFEKVGHPVVRLKRLSFGPVHLKDLPRGQHRILHPYEVSALYRAAALK
ncbi:MAG: pseudouridine synthase [Actinomycetota bacterium]|nr:pseudouridine synthase [Actinomycetota bacterium]